MAKKNTGKKWSKKSAHANGSFTARGLRKALKRKGGSVCLFDGELDGNFSTGVERGIGRVFESGGMVYLVPTNVTLPALRTRLKYCPVGKSKTVYHVLVDDFFFGTIAKSPVKSGDKSKPWVAELPPIVGAGTLPKLPSFSRRVDAGNWLEEMVRSYYRGKIPTARG